MCVGWKILEPEGRALPVHTSVLRFSAHAEGRVPQRFRGGPRVPWRGRLEARGPCLALSSTHVDTRTPGKPTGRGPAWPRSPSRPAGVQRGPLSDVLGLAVTAAWDGHTVDVPPSPGGSAPRPSLTDFPSPAEGVRSGSRRSAVSLLWDVVAFAKESGVERLLWAAGHQGLGAQQTLGTGSRRPRLSSTSGCCGHTTATPCGRRCCCCCCCCGGNSCDDQTAVGCRFHSDCYCCTYQRRDCYCCIYQVALITLPLRFPAVYQLPQQQRGSARAPLPLGDPRRCLQAFSGVTAGRGRLRALPCGGRGCCCLSRYAQDRWPTA